MPAKPQKDFELLLAGPVDDHVHVAPLEGDGDIGGGGGLLDFSGVLQAEEGMAVF